jgi:hypothetical protein
MYGDFGTMTKAGLENLPFHRVLPLGGISPRPHSFEIFDAPLPARLF